MAKDPAAPKITIKIRGLGKMNAEDKVSKPTKKKAPKNLGIFSEMVGHSRLTQFKILDDPGKNYEVTLDDKIHPIFARGNWPCTTDSLYKAIKPALQLASKLISEPHLLPWWHLLCLGETYYDKDLDRRILWVEGFASGVYLEELESDPEAVVQHIVENNLDGRTEDFFENFAKLTRVRWAVKNSGALNADTPDRYGDSKVAATKDLNTACAQTQGVSQDNTIWGVIGPDYKGKRHEKMFKGTEQDQLQDEKFVSTARITISRHLKMYFTNVLGRKATTSDPNSIQNEYLRACWILATTLCHELAHAVVLMRFPCTSAFGDDGGPNIDDTDVADSVWQAGDTTNEIGLSWENWCWGGIIQPSIIYKGVAAEDRDGSGELLVREVLFDGASGEFGLWRQPWMKRIPWTMYAVPMTWIGPLFDEEFWQRVATEGKSAIPPAKSKLRIYRERVPSAGTSRAFLAMQRRTSYYRRNSKRQPKRWRVEPAEE